MLWYFTLQSCSEEWLLRIGRENHLLLDSIQDRKKTLLGHSVIKYLGMWQPLVMSSLECFCEKKPIKYKELLFKPLLLLYTKNYLKWTGTDNTH